MLSIYVNFFFINTSLNRAVQCFEIKMLEFVNNFIKIKKLLQVYSPFPLSFKVDNFTIDIMIGFRGLSLKVLLPLPYGKKKH